MNEITRTFWFHELSIPYIDIILQITFWFYDSNYKYDFTFCNGKFELWNWKVNEFVEYIKKLSLNHRRFLRPELSTTVLLRIYKT